MGIEAIGSSTAVDLTSLAQSQATSASKAVGKTAPSGMQKAGGAPPAGGGGAPPVTSSSSSSDNSTDITKIYDKRDTNKDSVVSYQEELLYSIKHSADETESQSSVSNSQKQAGLNAYQQNQQTNGTAQSSLLFTT